MPSPTPQPDTRTIAEAGEREVLAALLARIPHGEVLLGPGDDAAVLAAPDGRVVVSTDTMIDGPDFRRAWSQPEHLGRKAVASNLADIVAMGAVPTGMVVALALPSDTTVEWVGRLADGFAAGVADLWPGCGIIGGDLARSEVLTIAVTVFGSLEGRAPVARAGARPGDVVAVAGALGEAAAGLSLLFRDAADADGTADADALADLRARHPALEPLIDAQLAPRPPLRAGIAAANAGATAMMDLSDGLLLDAHRIADMSGVTLDLHRAVVADDIAALAPHFDEPTAERLVFGGGEDHSLLACFPADAELPAPFRAIGTVLEADGSPVRIDGAPADPAGWDPYSASGSR